jgi:hypothetical protein
VVLGIGGHVVSRKLQIGDPTSVRRAARTLRYNIDNAFITANFALSSDVFAVIIKTPVEQCMRYATLQQADQLAWPLQQLPEIQATVSLADSVEQVTAGTYEGSAKWYTLSRNQEVLNYGAQQAIQNTPDLTNAECSVMPVIALGVGIGVDYALYLLSVQLHGSVAACRWPRLTGRRSRSRASLVAHAAAGVITWAWSPIKFQADMESCSRSCSCGTCSARLYSFRPCPASCCRPRPCTSRRSPHETAQVPWPTTRDRYDCHGPGHCDRAPRFLPAGLSRLERYTASADDGGRRQLCRPGVAS